MADLSHWFAQACECHDSEGTFKVIYFQDRQELITVREELLRNRDSWSDELFSSNMGSNVYKSQVTMPSPHTGSSQPCLVPARNSDLLRFFTCGLFDNLSDFSTVPKNDILKAFTALDQDVLANEGGSKAPTSQMTTTTNSSKNNVHEDKEKEKWIKYQKSIEQAGVLRRFIQWLTKDHRVYLSPNIEGTSSLPKELMDQWLAWENNPYRHSKPPEYRNKYALVFGITTEFNPSGVWVIEELYNDIEESDF